MIKLNPLNPDLTFVTPPTLVATLTRSEREQRVTQLIKQAHFIVDLAWKTHGTDRERVATCVLFSGGNDSTVLTHLMKERADYTVHCNTTIGIEQTRQFVRDVSKQFGLELLERTAPKSYRDLVIEKGFPGAAMHFKMYTRLKERPLEQVRRELVENPRRERVLFLAGRRRSESARRVDVPMHERKGSTVWASPICMWTKLDMNTYRLMHGDVPVNEVSELLHMSGECLCGSFAKPNELEEIRMWFPDVAAEIDELMKDVKAAGHKYPLSTWGYNGIKKVTQRLRPPTRLRRKVGPICQSCETQQDRST